MRAGRVCDGGPPITAIQRDGAWFAVADGMTALDALAASSPAPVDAEPLPGAYRTAVPLRPARNVLCLGKNYRAHAEEFAAYRSEAETVPEHPIVFTKAPEALCGATDAIAVQRDLGRALDYEVEFGVVIGRPGAGISRDDASAYVAGYTIVNDVTARDVQERHRQWFLGKSLPQATPIGPVIVSPDELDGLESRRISCSVNGELRQEAWLGEMVVGVRDAIALISATVPLIRGDVISMGTPSGVGIGFTPPRFLQDGDLVVCEIEGIGELRNEVRLIDSLETSSW